MAVLKRFSYDNIVEHNPTAPDPVEGGGGSGGGEFIIHVTSEESEEGTVYTADKTFTEIMSAISAGAFPIMMHTSDTVADFLTCSRYDDTSITFVQSNVTMQSRAGSETLELIQLILIMWDDNVVEDYTSTAKVRIAP